MTLPAVTRLADLPPDRRARIEMLAAQVETPHDRIIDGQSRRVEPTFCRAVIGDGAYLLIVTPVRVAPRYHAILIDSSWVRPATSRHWGVDHVADLDDEDRRDRLAEVLCDICGDADMWLDQREEEEGVDDWRTAPHGMFHLDMGFSWGIEPITSDGLLVDHAS